MSFTAASPLGSSGSGGSSGAPSDAQLAAHNARMREGGSFDQLVDYTVFECDAAVSVLRPFLLTLRFYARPLRFLETVLRLYRAAAARNPAAKSLVNSCLLLWGEMCAHTDWRNARLRCRLLDWSDTKMT